ncbi:MAG: histidinol-phosphatase HisJ family protein [Clostridiales bacterium]|nr:histidinol-phosphatase HisJ family protein [Clostridiales bacterium]
MYNFHTHTAFSDGIAAPVEYVKYAISNGMSTLGFSDHAPVPFDSSWNMPMSKLDGYICAISQLKNEYSSLNIRMGLELDYFDELYAPSACGYDLSAFDYVIGAVHYLAPDKATVDASQSEVDILFESEFKGDSHKFVRTYFEKYRNMLNSLRPQIAAHIDLISRRNVDFKYYDESDKVFTDELYNALKEVKRLGIFLEINTGAMSRGRDVLYPPRHLLGMVRDMDIPVLFGADAHSPQNLLCCFNEVDTLINTIGLRKADISDIIR